MISIICPMPWDICPTPWDKRNSWTFPKISLTFSKAPLTFFEVSFNYSREFAYTAYILHTSNNSL